MKDPYSLKGEELQAALLARDKTKKCSNCRHDTENDFIPTICMYCGWTFKTKWEAKEEKQLTLF